MNRPPMGYLNVCKKCKKRHHVQETCKGKLKARFYHYLKTVEGAKKDNK